MHGKTLCEEDKCRCILRIESEDQTALLCGGRHPPDVNGDTYRICPIRCRNSDIPYTIVLRDEDVDLNFNKADLIALRVIVDALLEADE